MAGGKAACGKARSGTGLPSSADPGGDLVSCGLVGREADKPEVNGEEMDGAWATGGGEAYPALVPALAASGIESERFDGERISSAPLGE